MRILFAGILLGLLVVTSKADEPNEIEYDEEEDPAYWKFDDEPEMDKPMSVEAAIRNLVVCLTEEHGKMTRNCMKKFRRSIPMHERNKMYQCAIDSWDSCRYKRPKDGNEFLACLNRLGICIYDEESIVGPGSGNNWF